MKCQPRVAIIQTGSKHTMGFKYMYICTLYMQYVRAPQLSPQHFKMSNSQNALSRDYIGIASCVEPPWQLLLSMCTVYSSTIWFGAWLCYVRLRKVLQNSSDEGTVFMYEPSKHGLRWRGVKGTVVKDDQHLGFCINTFPL